MRYAKCSVFAGKVEIGLAHQGSDDFIELLGIAQSLKVGERGAVSTDGLLRFVVN